MSSDRTTPTGTECADVARDGSRPMGSACKVCGHQHCGMAYQPCDICRLTIRILALEAAGTTHPSQENP